MEWKDVDWSRLRELRDRFLNPAPGDYWRTRQDLELYAHTFGQRIASKWRAICEELAPLVGDGRLTLLDWGCGSGVASQTWLECFGRERVDRVLLCDRSSLARGFARERLGRFDVPVEELGFDSTPTGPYWILVSHVAGELDLDGRRALRDRIDCSGGFVWVEPGTPECSRWIVDAREQLRATFEMLAPCPHQKECGMSAPENDRHWCHHFAPPSQDFFQSAGWTRFGKELGIDLRSLPVSYLAGRRGAAERTPPGARVIGRPRVYNGFAKVLVCDAEGVREKTVTQKQTKLKDLKGNELVRYL